MNERQQQKEYTSMIQAWLKEGHSIEKKKTASHLNEGSL